MQDYSSSRSGPDVIFKYEDHNILALNYKSPNIIDRREIINYCLGDLKLAQYIIRSRLPRGHATAGMNHRHHDDPTVLSNAKSRTKLLMKQAVKYSKKPLEISTVLFYDGEHLLAVQPPKGLDRGNNSMLMTVAISSEFDKSTVTRPVPNPDNHAVTLLRYIIGAARNWERERSASSSSRSQKNNQ